MMSEMSEVTRYGLVSSPIVSSLQPSKRIPVSRPSRLPITDSGLNEMSPSI